MKWRVELFVALALLQVVTAGAQQYAYQVNFTDKNNTPYSLSSPSAYLSPGALTRRTTQGISVDSTDLPVNHTYIDSVIALTGGTLHATSRWMNLCVILLSDSAQIHALDGKAFVRSSKLVGYYSTFLHHRHTNATGNAGAVAQRTASADNVFYGITWLQTDVVNGNYLYDKGYTGAGKLIAVLDAGFLGTDTHPGFDSLRAAGRVLDEHNFTLNSNFVYSYDTHGTSVLSTMAGYVPDTFVGSAPLASYALYVTEDDNSEQLIETLNMLCGIERADSIGADIVTTSLGYNTFNNAADNFNFATEFDGKTTIPARAANMATQKGMLVVATAGNEGAGSWNKILTPGDADSALTIGSVDPGTLINAATSGYGPNAAGKVKPDVCAVGQPANVFTASGYGSENGTSFSTPQIAGWAASLWQGNPTATPAQIRQAIIKCASRYTSPGPQIGYGIPNFECTSQMLNVLDTPSPFTADNWVLATPNPFDEGLKLAVSPAVSGNVDFRLTDMAGRRVFSVTYHLQKGYNTPFTITIPGLAAGLYILKANSATQQQVLKLEKR